MRERSAEVGAVDGTVSRGFRRVDVLASAAVKFYGFFVRDIRKPDGKQGLRLAENAGTAAKVYFFVFLELQGNWSG